MGTTFAYKVNRPASLALYFARVSVGRTLGDNCVALGAGAKSAGLCSRLVPAGELKLHPGEGNAQLRFAGRLAHMRALPPGRYAVALGASAEGERVRTRALEFTIIG